MNTYMIRRVTPESLTPNIITFACHAARDLTEKFGESYDWPAFQIEQYSREGYFFIAKHSGRIVGLLLFQIFESVFDGKTKVLQQDLLYSRRPTCTKQLLKVMIDFGKVHADHIITMTTPLSNLKGSSLEKLGFDKIETVYRMECR